MEIRRNPANPDEAALKTGPAVTAGAWFLFNANNGGAYTDGVRQGIADWPAIDEQENSNA